MTAVRKLAEPPFAVSVEDFDAWVARAEPKDALIYARGADIPRAAPAWKHAMALVEEGTVGADKVLSMQSKTRSGRSNAEQVFPASPVSDTTMTNATVAQAYIGGSYTGTQNMYGRLYGWVISNVTLDPSTTLFRVERQLTDAAGLPL